MPTTIEDAFDQLISQLRASKAEVATAASHRSSIKAKLEDSFEVTAFFRSGSFGNGTNVSGYSDVDYFAVIPTSKLKGDSAATLAEVAAALRARFPLTLNIRVNGPAVQVPFGLDGAEHTEIVPVDATGITKLGFRQFDMPDGRGGWMFTAPESHNAYVASLDKTLGARFKSLVRILKGWKFLRSVPIKSFYLEMFAARYASNEPAISFPLDLLRILQSLRDTGLPAIIDPRFPDDGRYLYPCETALQHTEALGKIHTAAGWAEDAWDHQALGRVAQAFNSWALVFNHAFPSYGY